MTVLDIIKTAVKLLGDTTLLAFLNGETEQPAYEEDKELLLISYNQTARSVATYFPLVYTESFSPVNGVVKYEVFTFNPYKIKKVISNDCNYEILPTEIKTNRDIKVEYCYFPKAEDYGDGYPFNFVVSDVEFSYGVLAEYLLYKGRYEESATYFDKFINALSSYNRANKKSRIPSREWF